MLPVVQVGDGDERFQRCVARARAESGQRRVDAGRACFDGDDAVGDRQGQVLVGVDADLGGRVLGRTQPR